MNKRARKKIIRILQKSIYIFVSFSLVLSYAYIPLGEIARRSDSPVLKQLAQFQPEIQKAYAALPCGNGTHDEGAKTCTYTSPGTDSFTVPANVYSIQVACWGAGGGGDDPVNAGGGGGGGGAFASTTIDVDPSDSPYAVVVGTGGGAETNGGNSTFGSTLLVAAGGTGATDESGFTGGAGGTAGGTSDATYCGAVGTLCAVEHYGGTGGTGFGGTGDMSGGGGGAGGPHADGENGYNYTGLIGGAGGDGDGASPPGGAGGDGGNGTNGSNGTSNSLGGGGGGGGDDGYAGGGGGSPGGGQGGMEKGTPGGNGGSGQCIVTYIISLYVTTNAATGITSTYALLNGNIDATGSGSVNTRGFAQGTSADLTTNVSTTTDTDGQPFGTGAFSVATTTLTMGTTYYFRAYAISDTDGTKFGAIQSFTAPGTLAASNHTIGQQTNPGPQSVIDYARNFQVKLTCMKDPRSNPDQKILSGSGTVIGFGADDRGRQTTYILTNRHVIEEAFSNPELAEKFPTLTLGRYPCVATTYAKTSEELTHYVAEIYKPDSISQEQMEKHDFALLRLTERVEEKPFFPIIPNASLVLSGGVKPQICQDRYFAPGEKLLVFGYSDIVGNFTLIPAVITRYDGNYLFISERILKGNSGGPAVSESGACLLGIASYIWIGDDPQSPSAILPLPFLQKHYLSKLF